MQLELHGAVERAILNRFRSGNYDSLEDVLAEAFVEGDQEHYDLVLRQKEARKRLLAELATLPPEYGSRPEMNAIDQTLYSDPFG